MTKQIEKLKKVLVSYDDNPEKINNSPVTAPSKQIIKAFESKHHYDKPKSGEVVTGKDRNTITKGKMLAFQRMDRKFGKDSY
jgi:hypothetical protein